MSQTEKDMLKGLATVVVMIALVMLSAFAHSELTRKDKQIQDLREELTFSVENYTTLQVELDTLKREYDVSVDEKEKLGEDVKKAEAKAVNEAAEAKKQKGIAWNAKNERDKIEAQKETIGQIASYYYLAASELEEAMGNTAMGMSEAIYDNWDSASYYVDLAKENQTKAYEWKGLADQLLETL